MTVNKLEFKATYGGIIFCPTDHKHMIVNSSGNSLPKKITRSSWTVSEIFTTEYLKSPEKISTGKSLPYSSSVNNKKDWWFKWRAKSINILNA